jgi:hypothetical protein
MLQHHRQSNLGDDDGRLQWLPTCLACVAARDHSCGYGATRRLHQKGRTSPGQAHAATVTTLTGATRGYGHEATPSRERGSGCPQDGRAKDHQSLATGGATGAARHAVTRRVSQGPRSGSTNPQPQRQPQRSDRVQDKDAPCEATADGRQETRISSSRRPRGPTRRTHPLEAALQHRCHSRPQHRHQAQSAIACLRCGVAPRRARAICHQKSRAVLLHQG